MSRVKVKSVEDVNEELKSSEFENNQHTDVKEHIINRSECPYCANPLLFSTGDKKVLDSHPLSLKVKRACSSKNSSNVKKRIHLIFIDERGTQIELIQTSGNLEGDYTWDD